MFKLLRPLSAALGAALLCACGGSSSPTATVAASTAHGTLAVNPPFRIASLNAATFQAQLAASSSGAQLLQITGNPSCGVDFYYIKFWTLGGAGETTESSGALMVPTGAAPACSGPRPIVLYAHGTNPDKTLNIADITNTSNTEGVLIAAMFAAQGYIVVAPNYAGYDISTLGYHPFLNAEQQSGEMIDILTAARTALPKTMSAATSDSGKLFVTGYSEGGHVAMATQRALEASGAVVTGAAPMSGSLCAGSLRRRHFLRQRRSRLDGVLTAAHHQLPEGLRQYLHHAQRCVLRDLRERHRNAAAERDADRHDFLDRLVAGDRRIRHHHAGGAAGSPTADGLPVGARQRQLSAASQRADPAVCGRIRLALPDQQFVSRSVCGSMRLTNPDGGTPSLPSAGAPLAGDRAGADRCARPSIRMICATAHGSPKSPTLLCGGDGDPTVFFSVNTGTMAAFWAPLVQAGLITVLDVGGTPAGPFAAVQAGFQESQAAQLALYESAAGGGLSPEAAAAAHRGELPHLRGALLHGRRARIFQ